MKEIVEDTQENVVSDETDVERNKGIKKRDRTKREQEREDVRLVAGAEHGRRFLRRLLRLCRVNGLTIPAEMLLKLHLTRVIEMLGIN